MNKTIENFGYPQTLVAEWDYWVLMVRVAQVTKGSLILAAKSDATAFSHLPQEAFLEQKRVVDQIEAALKATVGYQKMNYLMLMMVDPHVHYHVLPRYEEPKRLGDVEIDDAGWPGPPNLGHFQSLTSDQIEHLKAILKPHFNSNLSNQ